MSEVVDFHEDPNGGLENTTGVSSTIMSTDGVLVAPTLRVEELKFDDSIEVLSGYSSGSSVYGTDDEYALSGEASDQDQTEKAKEEKKPDAEFEIPSEELKTRIIDQVEYYFSNENIIHDAFMLKHVRRNKMGYVSLKLVTSFRKVKSLTKDFRVVAYCLESSNKLEVNEERTKVRRTEPLPEFDETTPSRTIIAANLPFPNPSVEDVAELFAKYGEITLIRVVRPGKPVPQDVKKYFTKHPELGNTVCTVIEYEKHESARSACEIAHEEGDDRRKDVKVYLLAASKKKEENKEEKKATKENLRPTNGRKTNDRSVTTSPKNNTQKDEQEVASGQIVHVLNQSANRLSPGCSPRTTPRSSPRSSPKSSPRASPISSRRRSNHGPSPLAAELLRSSSPSNLSGHDHEGGSLSPWVQRRMKAQEDSTDALEVVRQPKGPDGTRGFQLIRTNLIRA